ncbi:DMT family transporter [Candidatus Uabimicrobium amorphum]|uniref:Membrane protein n=1 Tax=Uabimicrobium amorphum TaxID=2596890 RepID=A0A5S9IUL5_UABAM|nr:DMT family transporter [Candidatus Uabimicrobium amorphum]BBM88037.1 membrane protein [Candidatus Uabimicrobium amorphum]
MKNQQIQGIMLLFAAVIILASSNSVVKKLVAIGAQNPINPITFCNVLFVGNLCALLSLLIIYRKDLEWSFFRSASYKEILSLISVAVLSVAIAPACIFIALENTTVTNVVLIGRIEPPLLLFLSILLLKDRASKLQIAGAITSFVGAILSVILQQNIMELSFGKGEIYAAVGAIAFTCSTVISKTSLDRIPMCIFAIFRMVVGTIVFFTLATYLYGLQHFSDAFSGTLWKWMLLYGGIIVVAGQLCWFSGLRIASPSTVPLITTFSPVAGLLAAFLILGEVPSSAQFIGGFIILCGMALSLKKPKVPDVKAQMDTEVGFKGV